MEHWEKTVYMTYNMFDTRYNPEEVNKIMNSGFWQNYLLS